MKVIIAGSRDLGGYDIVDKAVSASGFDITEVVSGGARGVDKAGEKWAAKHDLPTKQFIPDWENSGASAGFQRNTRMAFYADALIAVWDGKSRGTLHMIREAVEVSIPVYVYCPPRG